MCAYQMSGDQLGANKNKIAKAVTVTRYKDNPDGTTTHFLSDGSTSIVRYTKMPDGSLQPREVGGTQPKKQGGVMDTLNKISNSKPVRYATMAASGVNMLTPEEQKAAQIRGAKVNAMLDKAGKAVVTGQQAVRKAITAPTPNTRTGSVIGDTIQDVGGGIVKGARAVKNAVGMAGNLGKAFIRNVTGGDIKKLDNSWNGGVRRPRNPRGY